MLMHVEAEEKHLFKDIMKKQMEGEQQTSCSLPEETTEKCPSVVSFDLLQQNIFSDELDSGTKKPVLCKQKYFSEEDIVFSDKWR